MPLAGCSECPACVAGQEHLCRVPRFPGLNRDGGCANFVIIPHPRYLIRLDGLDPLMAAPLVCSGLTTYSALKKLDANTRLKQQPIVVIGVIGAGGLGLMSLQILKMVGGMGAVVVEIDPSRQQAAIDGVPLQRSIPVRQALPN